MNELEVIKTEEEAWKLLELLVNNFDAEERVLVEFSGWPDFHLAIKGEKYSSSIPGPLLAQLSKIQTLSNRYYGWLIYEGDARNIKKSEKEGLELLFSVQKGSTEIKADLSAFLTNISEALSNEKTTTRVAITLIVLALSASGSIIIPQISKNISDQERDRIALQTRALELAAEESDSASDFAKTYKDIISSVSDADSISIGSRSLSSTEIKKISGERRIGEDITLEGNYKIKALRQYENYFTISTSDQKGYSIRARVYRKLISQYPNLLQELTDSLTSGSSVFLRINIKEFEDGYGSGLIVGAGT